MTILRKKRMAMSLIITEIQVIRTTTPGTDESGDPGDKSNDSWHG
jgi:hypothetical protein